MSVKPKKHLGQHFLKDESVSKRIAEAIRESGIKNILEIGPGTGALTKYLLEYPEINLKVIEIDDESVEYLHEHYPHLEVLEKDFLREDLTKIMGSEQFAVVGNFPYNISTQIIFKVLEYTDQITGVIGMFQKEVAERFVSPHGSKVYGITSVLTQAFYTPEYLFTVPEDAFNPPPKVKSGVISLMRNDREELPVDLKRFKEVVKLAFNQRRKTLRNSLKSLWKSMSIDPDQLGDVMQKRPEQLDVENFIVLTKHFSVKK